MEKQILDYTLVPAGLVMMVGYHIWLLCQVLNHPSTTVIGFHAINRRFWVSAMMQEGDQPRRDRDSFLIKEFLEDYYANTSPTI